MFTILKWIAALVLAAVIWLVAQITFEYFHPYRRRTH